MTQDELDSLMNGDAEIDGVLGDDEAASEADAGDDNKGSDDKSVTSSTPWPPPPPTTDHKVVSQLDDVTKGIESKANQVFDYLETMSTQVMEIENDGRDLQEFIKRQRALLEKLHEKFPKVATFSDALADVNEAQKKIDAVITASLDTGDSIMSIMDTMQYQDIHRQKIERVINVMRALAKYMNSLFEGQIDDSKRVASAVHIPGDDTADVMDENDIEALISSLGGGRD